MIHKYMDDVLLNKIATIERCLMRVNEEAEKDWRNNYTNQDALILNIERACQATIDLSMHIVRKKKLGLPKFTREVFDMLVAEEILSLDVGDKLKRMVGFRNLAVHDYSNLNLEIVDSIIKNELSVFYDFKKEIISRGSDHD